jgi:hypothetical protein
MAIRRAWPQLRAVCTLFRWCLELGWHPTPFRAATLRNQGRAETRAIHGHIGLLLYSRCSGKASHDGLRGQQSARKSSTHTVHCGPTREDLAAAVIHDIEESWARGKVVSLLTLDVRRAFDAVLPGRLIKGPHGYADMNISMDISMNITDMNTMFFSWIISMDISVLSKFHGYEYGYAPNIHEYSWI